MFEAKPMLITETGCQGIKNSLESEYIPMKITRGKQSLRFNCFDHVTYSEDVTIAEKSSITTGSFLINSGRKSSLV